MQSTERSNKPEPVWVKGLQGLFADGNQASGTNLAERTGDAGWRERAMKDGARETGRFLWALASPGSGGMQQAGPAPAPPPRRSRGGNCPCIFIQHPDDFRQKLNVFPTSRVQTRAETRFLKLLIGDSVQIFSFTFHQNQLILPPPSAATEEDRAGPCP